MKPHFDQTNLADSYRSKGVAEIYSTRDRENMGKLDHAPNRTKQYVVTIVVLVLLIATGMAWLGFNLFSTQTAFKKDNVTLRITAPGTIASGSVVTYHLDYTNNDRSPVSDAAIEVEYPVDFKPTEANPSASNEQKTRWNIGVLKGGDTGSIEIKGRIVGDKKAIELFKAKLVYQPIKLSSSFEVNQTFTTTIDSSVLQVELKGSNQAVEGEQVSYQISYPDFSQVEQKDKVQLRMKYPDGFVFSDADPKPDTGQNIWNSVTLLGKTIGGQMGTIELKGVASKKTDTDLPLVAQIGFVDGDNFRVEQESTIGVKVVKGDLLISLSVNGSDSSNEVAHFGDTLTHTITYENKGSVALKDLVIKAKVEGKAIDWGTMRDTNGGSYEGDTVTWTGAQVEGLKELAAGAKGSITFAVSLLEASQLQNLKLSGGLDRSSLSSRSTASAHFGMDGEAPTTPTSVTAKDLMSGTIVRSIVTDLTFQQQVRYFNDDKATVGTGPIPPKVGQATTYRVYWRLNDTINDAQDVTVMTKLPAAVSWINQTNVPTGEMSYDAKSRTVTWHIGKLTAQNQATEGSFDVSLTPQTKDTNKVVILVNEANLTALDATNQGTLSAHQDGATTNLDGDPVMSGKGLIEP